MGFSSVKNVELIQSNLKSQFLVIIDYSVGKKKKHIEVYALCIDPTRTRVAK